jgi:hypothetical protein
VQARLEVGQPDDEYEREAERVADEVVRMRNIESREQGVGSGRMIGPRGRLYTHPSGSAGITVPPEVETEIQSLRGGGRPLSDSERAFFEPRFGCDFSNVRIHDDACATETARAVNARAYTVGSHIVFGAGQYVPKTTSGSALLAHEIVHTQQQTQPGAVGRVLQRDDDEDSAGSGASSQTLSLGGGQGRRLGLGLGSYQLHLDPEMMDQFQALQLLETSLALDNLLAATDSLDQPILLPPIPSETTRPAVPAGRGPETPRSATMGDVLSAVLAVPAVASAVNRLRTTAVDHVERAWEHLETGERVVTASAAVALAGAAIAGVASSPEARQFVLGQIQGRDISIPGTPLSVRFNVTGPEQMLFIGLDLGSLLPPAWGFGPHH